MTILNFWITPQRAIVATDTNVQPFGASSGARSKLLVFPHAKVALAGRGGINTLGMLFQCLHALANDFDAMLLETERHLPTIIKTVQDGVASQGVAPELFARQEVALIGWSPALNRFAARVFDATSEGVTKAPHDYAFAPGDSLDLSNFQKKPFAKGAMLELMREQLRWARKNGEGESCGGRMVYLDMTRDSMDLSSDTKIG